MKIEDAEKVLKWLEMEESDFIKESALRERILPEDERYITLAVELFDTLKETWKELYIDQDEDDGLTDSARTQITEALLHGD